MKMPNKDTMISKSRWATDRMKEAVRKGDIASAQKYSEISSAYSRAAGKYCGKR
jgi:hypothetical protein